MCSGSSRSSHKHKHFRGWGDPLMWSNGSYLVVSGHAYTCEVYDVAILAVFVAVASSLYHLHAERCYLALDAAFAGLLFLMAILCLVDACKESFVHWMVVSASVLFPTLIYLFVKCDLPGTKHYDSYHTLWHFCTSIGTSIVVVYLEQETETKLSFELFDSTAFTYGVVFALACLLSMKDVVERTFFKHVKQIVKENPEAISAAAGSVVVTETNEVIINGCRVGSNWFWIGLALQTMAAFLVLGTGMSDFMLLLGGASISSLVYHRMHSSKCSLTLDFLLCCIALLALVSAFLVNLGYNFIAQWLVLTGAALIGLMFVHMALGASVGEHHHHHHKCTCSHSKGGFTSFIVNLRTQSSWFRHRMISHMFITCCNCIAAVLLVTISQ